MRFATRGRSKCADPMPTAAVRAFDRHAIEDLGFPGIVLMENGRITAIGTHEELLASSPLYQEIYESQLGGVEEDVEDLGGAARLGELLEAFLQGLGESRVGVAVGQEGAVFGRDVVVGPGGVGAAHHRHG